MSITFNTTYSCDFAGCPNVLTDSSDDAASAAGWTYFIPPWALNTFPQQPGVRCATHMGQA